MLFNGWLLTINSKRRNEKKAGKKETTFTGSKV